jgi:hypothetical protein
MTRSSALLTLERMKTEPKTVRTNGIDIHYLERGSGAFEGAPDAFLRRVQ